MERFRWSPDERSRALIGGGISVSLATRNQELLPNLSRAIGCFLGDDGLISIIVTGSESVDLIADLAANGAVAAVFSKPSTHQTLQLKATRVEVAPATQIEIEAALRTREGLLQDLSSVGYSPEFSNAFMRVDRADLMAVRFHPECAFDQTPGPQAGKAIGV